MARHSSPRTADDDFIRIHAASPPAHTESFNGLPTKKFAALPSPRTTYSVSTALFRYRAAYGCLPKKPWGAAARGLHRGVRVE